MLPTSNKRDYILDDVITRLLLGLRAFCTGLCAGFLTAKPAARRTEDNRRLCLVCILHTGYVIRMHTCMVNQML